MWAGDMLDLHRLKALNAWIDQSTSDRSKWRRAAVEAMIAAVKEARSLLSRKVSTPIELLRIVDDAYPFGEREHQPYKAWLQERQAFILATASEEFSTAEWEAIAVARDAEESGRFDLASGVLRQVTHDMHATTCPICGAKKSKACRNLDAFDDMPLFVDRGSPRLELIVPHQSRLEQPIPVDAKAGRKPWGTSRKVRVAASPRVQDALATVAGLRKADGRQ